MDIFGTGDTSTTRHLTSNSSGVFEETLSYDETTVRAVFDVDWSRRYGIAKAILGYPQLKQIPGAAGFFISRKLPHAHKAFIREDFDVGGSYFVFAQKVSMVGIGQPSAPDPLYPDQPNYPKARLTVEYGTPTYDVVSDDEMRALSGGGTPDESSLYRYVTFQDKPSADYITLPTGTFKQVGGASLSGSPIATGTGKMLSSVNVQMIWHQIPRAGVPYLGFNSAATNSAIDGSLGKVNETPFHGYPSGTLLLMAVDISPKRSPAGARIYDITYMMKYAPFGHNYVYRPQDATPAFYEITTDGVTNQIAFDDGKSPYDWIEFANLFRTATQV